MNQRFKVVLSAIGALVCALCLSKEAVGQTLPDGKGKAEFVHNCTACHTAKLVTRLPKTPDEWKVNVREMAARGTDGSKEDLDNVVLYLVTNFATDTSGPAQATQSTTPSSTSGGSAVLNSTEIERAKHVITDNGCLTCHRVEKQGAYTGPTLNGLGARRSANEIRAAIVSAHHPVYRGNNIVTPWLEKITGEDLDVLVRYLGSLPSVDETVQK